MMLEAKQKWWQTTVFYEIYIASFQDSNGDGIGDFNGLASRLDYLQNLGVNGLWVTPFYPSPKMDNGYDVADYFDVDPDFGSLADFDYFIAEAHKRNIKVIIDVVLNHVSTAHEWFREATASPDSKYRDYFFFRDRANDRESFFGGSAWEQEPNGNQLYYHKFSAGQADLDWRNKAVMDDMLIMLKFWLERGVDGFRFDVINFLSCNGVDDDNPRDAKGQQIHCQDIDQPGIEACIAGICAFVREHNGDCFLVGEVGHEQLAKLARYQRDDLLDVVFNFNLGSIAQFDIGTVYLQLLAMEDQLDGLPTIFFNSHDMNRSMSRLCHDDHDQAAALAALTLTARGISFLYFGEEIGLPGFIPENMADMHDIQAINHYNLAMAAGQTTAQAYGRALESCRDKSRSYMQWNDEKFSGFSTIPPWIGATAPTPFPNVAEQISDPDSLWHWYQKLITLRRASEPLNSGDYASLILDKKLLSFSRSGHDQIIHVWINFNNSNQIINHNESHEILASRGISPDQPDQLSPFGVLITRERKDVCKTFGI